MKYKISKELFEAVMNIKIKNEPKADNEQNITSSISYVLSKKDKDIDEIWIGILSGNFIIECIKWAKEEKNYTITANYNYAIVNYNYNIDLKNPIKIFKHGNYGQNIIDACQWIYEQQKER